LALGFGSPQEQQQREEQQRQQAGGGGGDHWTRERSGLKVGVRSLELQYNIGQPIATTRHKLNIQSQSRQQ